MSDNKVPINNEKPSPNKEIITNSKNKLFRLITVGMYLAGVGGLGFTISIYMLFFWDSRMPVIEIISKNNRI